MSIISKQGYGLDRKGHGNAITEDIWERPIKSVDNAQAPWEKLLEGISYPFPVLGGSVSDESPTLSDWKTSVENTSAFSWFRIFLRTRLFDQEKQRCKSSEDLFLENTFSTGSPGFSSYHQAKFLAEALIFSRLIQSISPTKEKW